MRLQFPLLTIFVAMAIVGATLALLRFPTELNFYVTSLVVSVATAASVSGAALSSGRNRVFFITFASFIFCLLLLHRDFIPPSLLAQQLWLAFDGSREAIENYDAPYRHFRFIFDYGVAILIGWIAATIASSLYR